MKNYEGVIKNIILTEIDWKLGLNKFFSLNKTWDFLNWLEILHYLLVFL